MFTFHTTFSPNLPEHTKNGETKMVGLIEPTYKIVIEGNPQVIEYKTADSSTIKPGDLVYISGTNTISEGGAATGSSNVGIGIASYEHANSMYKPATRTDVYDEKVPAPVILSGSGAIVMANVTDVAASDALTGQASAGEQVRGIIGTNHIYSIALKTKSGSGLAPIILL